MKSTGEVMGVAADFPAAYAKSQLAIDYSLPTSGTAFISVCDRDKRQIASLAKHLQILGFSIMSTRGTAKAAARGGHPGHRGSQEARGSAEHHRPHRQRRGAARDQHAVRAGDALGRLPHALGGDPPRHHQHHDASRRPRRSSQAIEAVKEGRLGVYALQDFDGEAPRS